MTMRRTSRVVVFLLAVGCGDDSAPSDGLTHGDGTIDDPCTFHSDCAAGFMCAIPKGTCFRGTWGEAECKANADCAAGSICDQLYTTCVVGQCSLDVECDPPHCDRNGINKPPFSCVQCESDAHCGAGGDCQNGVCL